MSELRWAKPGETLRNTTTNKTLILTEDLLQAYDQVEQSLAHIDAQLELTFQTTQAVSTETT